MSFSLTSGGPPEQTAYSNRIKQLLLQKGITNPKACVITYGCQQNVSDSQRMKGLLAEIGYSFTDEPQNADFILFNTCAVRGHAEDRVYGNVGATKKYKQSNPNLIIAVCGCMVQQPTVAERFRKSYPYVDILFGTQVQHRLPEFIYKRITLGKRVYELSLDNKEVVEGIPVYRESKIKGFLPVMYGCDNFCTYCIVPYVRGRERSRDPEEIISEAVQMVNDGCKEIMLLGQNVNSYGKGIENGIDFADLLYRINAIDGDFRIRFMTSHPKDCTEKLLDAIRDCEKVERHLHLPFQSGSDEILKKMNRRYDSSAYLELIRKARERMPDITFTSDVIVGFPQETYEDFKKTVELVKSVRFLSLFTFIYSPRTGTPAAAMDDPVSREEKGKWFDELLRVQQSVTDEIMKSFEGKTVRVLCEEASTNCGMLTGKASNGISVEFAADECLLGKFVNVKINSYNGTLKGTLLKEERNGD